MLSASDNDFFWKAKLSAHERYAVFCFPFAGGSADYYRNWHATLDSTASIWPIQIPGRGNLYGLTPCISMFSLAKRLASVVLSVNRDHNSSIFFGHSMGALLAYETARQMQILGETAPGGIILSGCAAPHNLSPYFCGDPSDDELLEYIKSLGAKDVDSIPDSDLINFLGPALRADLKMVSSYHPPQTRISSNFLVIGGENDKLNNASDLFDWKYYTSGNFMQIEYPGGHFFIDEYLKEIMLNIREFSEFCSGF